MKNGRWTKDEIAELHKIRRMFEVERLAKKINRTPAGILSKMCSLGITMKKNSHQMSRSRVIGNLKDLQKKNELSDFMNPKNSNFRVNNLSYNPSQRILSVDMTIETSLGTFDSDKCFETVRTLFQEFLANKGIKL